LLGERDRFPQYVQIADVIGEKKDEPAVELGRLLI
jgi:hypothetical protein